MQGEQGVVERLVELEDNMNRKLWPMQTTELKKSMVEVKEQKF